MLHVVTGRKILVFEEIIMLYKLSHRSMGISIEFISHLPMELQEDILRHISNRMDKDFPIEIDDNVYFVEKLVAKLIGELTDENIRLRYLIDEINGIPKN